MDHWVDRRAVLLTGGALAVVPVASTSATRADTGDRFLAEAQHMKEQAVGWGDQPFGAVLVLDGVIVGWGPSRVVVDRDANAHAERVALWDAQKRLARPRIEGAVIYSTSLPCAICQRALAAAGVSRMIWGANGLANH